MTIDYTDIIFIDQNLRIGFRSHMGGGPSIVYLHGLGTSGSDFLTKQTIRKFSTFNLLSFDFPGCGLSKQDLHLELDMNDLVKITKMVLDKCGISKFHLIGHSMGGLVGTLLASEKDLLIMSFINLEGNLFPIDCRVFSEFICNHLNEENNPNFYLKLKSHLSHLNKNEHDKFFKNVANNISPKTMLMFSKSIVDHSKNSSLYSKFIHLEINKSFIYGEENNDLPYLNDLREMGIPTYEIPKSNHFPFYSNLPYFLNSIYNFFELTRQIK